MAADIILWLSSINTIMATLSKISDSANALYSKWYLPKDKTSELRDDIAELQDKIDHVGQIGNILNDYIKYYLGTYLIYMLSDKLVEQINLYDSKLKSKEPIYWAVIESPFRDLEEERSRYINIILSNKDLLDVKDASQITLMATQISEKCSSANANLRTRSTDEFMGCIRDINSQSLSLYRVFENSISRMTNGLITLKR